MNITDKIMRMVGESKLLAAPVSEDSDLYADLGFDSLAFIKLLFKIESDFSIKFELPEMAECLKISNLIALTEKKISENSTSTA